jgi:hypothetical protein
MMHEQFEELDAFLIFPLGKAEKLVGARVCGGKFRGAAAS